MAVPTPPTAGEPIAEAWGDVVHDSIVAMDIQVGQAVCPATGSGVAQSSIAVVFPRPFASTPTVIACAVDTGFIGTARDETATGFNLWNANRDNSGSLGARTTKWIAYGPRA